MKQLTVGILAHVDSGKTTLSEAMLYETGEIRKLGRVDHGDSFLDGESLERSRGITIFSKQAELAWNDVSLHLLDTPGHVDFSAEMERTLSVLDYAVLVISASDGVQSHTETLWKLLRHYEVPCFLFVNKMDLAVRKQEEIEMALQERLGAGVIDFSRNSEGEDFWDALSLNSEGLTEELLETGALTDASICQAIAKREVFPCYFGSALKMEGVKTFLEGLERFTQEDKTTQEFAARAFKVSRDERGERLVFVKILGGTLHVKDVIGDEKVNQIRIYSGLKYKMVEEAPAGTVCALTGLTETKAGDGLGAAEKAEREILEPFLDYRVLLPGGADEHRALQQFRELAEEDPMLHVTWGESDRCIHLQMMGKVQLEVLTELAKQRFGLDVEFDQGSIVYKETITEPVEGIGHFEPLRHYAEVHVILEPQERGSGVTYSTIASEDALDRNWQRLILTHLAEREHRGVLTGAPITDVKITLAAGRAHKKHTEGGDFREATYRSVRNGLMRGESRLLEPWFDFELTVPTESIGRAMADLQRMQGTFGEPEAAGDMSLLKGRCPVSEMKDYPDQIRSYTSGRGKITLFPGGYDFCHNEEEVLKASTYDPERDVIHTADSVFCSHGSGIIVPWDEIEDHMHLPLTLKEGGEVDFEDLEEVASRAKRYARQMASDDELMAIFERTYGPVRRSAPGGVRKPARKPPTEAQFSGGRRVKQKTKTPTGPLYVLVDGYNLIHAWPELADVAKADFGAARGRLIDILCNYQGFTQYEVIVVFDAYKVKGGVGSNEKVRNIHVVYTKEAETADLYIEKATHDMAKKHNVRVVTSDGMEQLIIVGNGARAVSSPDFMDEVKRVEDSIASWCAELF